MSDLPARALANAQIAAERAAQRREENRRLMPLAYAEIQKVREWFGEPKAFRLTENGRTVEWRGKT